MKLIHQKNFNFEKYLFNVLSISSGDLLIYRSLNFEYSAIFVILKREALSVKVFTNNKFVSTVWSI